MPFKSGLRVLILDMGAVKIISWQENRKLNSPRLDGFLIALTKLGNFSEGEKGEKKHNKMRKLRARKRESQK